MEGNHIESQGAVIAMCCPAGADKTVTSADSTRLVGRPRRTTSALHRIKLNLNHFLSVAPPYWFGGNQYAYQFIVDRAFSASLLPQPLSPADLCTLPKEMGFNSTEKRKGGWNDKKIKTVFLHFFKKYLDLFWNYFCFLAESRRTGLKPLLCLLLWQPGWRNIWTIFYFLFYFPP